MSRCRIAPCVLALLLAYGCDGDELPDAGIDADVVDAGSSDAGADGSVAPMDAGGTDAGATDAGAADAGADGGMPPIGCVVTASPGSGATYYVSPTGSASNSGTSADAPFSLEHAFNVAAAGDTVHVLAGEYGPIHPVTANSGTVDEPIRFLGYRVTPGDIESAGGPTYRYGDSWDADAMPTLTGTWVDQEGEGTGIHVRGDFIQLENFQVRHYERGIVLNGNRSCARNVAALETGDYNPLHTYPDPEPNAFLNYNGNGIVVEGEDHELRDAIVVDSGAQGITLSRCDGCIVDHAEVHAVRTENPTDYYFLIGTESSNTRSTNITVHRHGALRHGGHGICFKGTGAIENNVVDGFSIRNTKLELQFPGVANNTVRNGEIIIESEGEYLNDSIGIALANGAHENRFENIYSRGGGVYFRDWNDGLAGDVDDSSDGNVFVNLVVDSARFSVSFHPFGNGNFASSADDNTFLHCTFYGGVWLFENSRANSNTRFINCAFDSMERWTIERAGSPGYPLDVSFDHCNFADVGFDLPSGENLTEHPSGFVAPMSHDFALSDASALIDQGTDTDVEEGFDGATRPAGAGPDIGAFEHTP
ncbi:MAG: choice-of-anchor Q domain-containing protein [Sandaracinaceae bacterium]